MAKFAMLMLVLALVVGAVFTTMSSEAVTFDGKDEGEPLICTDGLRLSVRLSPSKPDGREWDIGTGPDPRGMVTITNPGGAKPRRESVALRRDSYRIDGRFFKSGLKILPGAKIAIKLVDDDLQYHDPIGGITITYDGSKHFKSRSFSGNFSCY